MNLNIKIDKNGNLVNMDTGTVLIASSTLFPSPTFIAVTEDDYWKVINQSYSTISPNYFSTFNSGDTIAYYFKIYLPISSNKAQIFEFDLGNSDSKDIGFYRTYDATNWALYLNSRIEIPLLTNAAHLIQGYFIMAKSATTVAVAVKIEELIDSTPTTIVETTANISGISSNNIGFAVGYDLHYGSAELVPDTRYYNVVPYNNDTTLITPISGEHKYLDYTGLQTLVTDIINYHTAHTVDAYSKTEIDNMLLNYYRNDGFGISSFGLSYFGGRG